MLLLFYFENVKLISYIEKRTVVTLDILEMGGKQIGFRIIFIGDF